MHSSHFQTIGDLNVAVLGLGYVGLPLAVEFAKTRSVIGYDINAARISQLMAFEDRTNEVLSDDLESVFDNLQVTNDISLLARANFYIVTVPTPIDQFNRPDLGPLELACATIATVLKPGDIVVFESTVFPGCTEDYCVPILESKSQLKFNIDFYCGYSPERINPGDKTHRIHNIVKVTSGSTEQVAEIIDQLYSEIILVGTYRASSIKVAEAAKVIENTQRDINVAFVNELAMLFDRLDIDVHEVLEAASTKWNFLNFKPGLVGGHCIGIDPYYLIHKAEEVGFVPQMILSGRRVNLAITDFFVTNFMKRLIPLSIISGVPRILILGLTFKENCPDIRNSKVFDLYRELTDFGCDVEIYDPIVNEKIILGGAEINCIPYPKSDYYDGVIIAVGHQCFIDIGAQKIKSFGKVESLVLDLKNIFEGEFSWH
jgi:UDP-N-acetyl-D-galactosamine dehydrogenase